MKATKLKPKVAMLTSPVQSLAPTERIRGSVRQQRNYRLLADEPMCRVCKKRAAMEIDHIVPLECGGDESESNLQPICIPCHTDKTASEALQRTG